jgi:hypothetical protein
MLEQLIEPVIEPVVEEVVSNKENTSAPTPAPEEPTLLCSPELVPQNESESVSEPKLFDISLNVIVKIVEENLVDLVKKYIEDEDMKKKISIPLTPEITNVINNIISITPNTLNDIEKVVVEIVKDDRIDSKDVPNLIIVIQRLYQFIYSLKNLKFDAKKRAEITCDSLKYLLHIFVIENKIKIEEMKQPEFLTQTNDLIDACTSLLNFSKAIKSRSCFHLLSFTR